MSNSQITEANLLEAQLAAHLAARPTQLPSPSVYFQDFNFGGTMWDAAFGNVDGGSISGVGEAVADVAINNVLEMEERKRKEDDPAKDAGLIVEAGERQREAMRKIAVGGIELSIEEWDGIAETLNDPELQSAVRDELMAQGKSAAEANDIIYLTQMAAQIAQKEGRGEPLTAEERSVQQRLENNQVDRDRLETGTQTVQRLNSQSQSKLTIDETRNADVAQVANDAEFREIALETTTEKEVARAKMARSGMSAAGNPFESNYSPIEEFNAQAAGIQIADATPDQAEPVTPSQTINAAPG